MGCEFRQTQEKSWILRIWGEVIAFPRREPGVKRWWLQKDKAWGLGTVP